MGSGWGSEGGGDGRDGSQCMDGSCDGGRADVCAAQGGVEGGIDAVDAVVVVVIGRVTVICGEGWVVTDR